MFQSHHWWEIFWGAVLGIACLLLGLWLRGLGTHGAGGGGSRGEADLRARLTEREGELAACRARGADRDAELDRLRRQLETHQSELATLKGQGFAGAIPELAEPPALKTPSPSRATPPAPAAAEPVVTDAGDDDLEEIYGVGPKLAQRLRAAGVTTFREIAEWKDADIDAFDARLPEFKGRIRKENWAASARECYERKYGPLSAGEPEPPPAPAERSGPVATEPDDLVAIYGVGPKLARLLNDQGVTTFRQVARWTPGDVARFSALLPDFKDRIEQEGWIASAASEHEKKYGDAP